MEVKMTRILKICRVCYEDLSNNHLLKFLLGTSNVKLKIVSMKKCECTCHVKERTS